MADEPRKGPKIQLQMDEQTAQGQYANLVLINHSENEFVLDFAFVQPTGQRAKVGARVIVSPRQMKRMMSAMKTNLDRYEKQHGTIDTGGAVSDSIVH